MTDFTLHSVNTAPAAAKPLLENAQKRIGFIPNLLAMMAEAPVTLEAYLTLNQLMAKSSFSGMEVQLLALAISAENGCDYCIAAHGTTARQQHQIPQTVIDAIQKNQPLADTKLNALVTFARSVTVKRGYVDDHEVDAFLQAGYNKAQVLEVITAIAMKTLSNYTNHIVKTPVDAQFSG